MAQKCSLLCTVVELDTASPDIQILILTLVSGKPVLLINIYNRSVTFHKESPLHTLEKILASHTSSHHVIIEGDFTL